MSAKSDLTLTVNGDHGAQTVFSAKHGPKSGAARHALAETSHPNNPRAAKTSASAASENTQSKSLKRGSTHQGKENNHLEPQRKRGKTVHLETVGDLMKAYADAFNERYGHLAPEKKLLESDASQPLADYDHHHHHSEDEDAEEAEEAEGVDFEEEEDASEDSDSDSDDEAALVPAAHSVTLPFAYTGEGYDEEEDDEDEETEYDPVALLAMVKKSVDDEVMERLGVMVNEDEEDFDSSDFEDDDADEDPEETTQGVPVLPTHHFHQA